jgi:hypothetical protein
MGTPHPKALRAASQEAWPDTGQTLGNAAQARCDRSNISAIFAKFLGQLTHIRQRAAEFRSVHWKDPPSGVPFRVLGSGSASRHQSVSKTRVNALMVPRRLRDTMVHGANRSPFPGRSAARSGALHFPTRIIRRGVTAWSRGLEPSAPSAPGHVIATPWHDMLHACSAVEVFDFFHSTGLATHS